MFEGHAEKLNGLQALNGSGGPPSKAVLSALRTLQVLGNQDKPMTTEIKYQDKIKMLEDDRQQLQVI